MELGAKMRVTTNGWVYTGPKFRRYRDGDNAAWYVAMADVHSGTGEYGIYRHMDSDYGRQPELHLELTHGQGASREGAQLVLEAVAKREGWEKD